MAQDAMRTFGELLKEYMDRTGISDAELARTLGVRRQTVFRWKEGSVVRPRHPEDVLRCAQRLRLTAEERDELLMAAGFPPQSTPALPPPAVSAPPGTKEIVAELLQAPTQAARRGVSRRWLWTAGGVAVIAVIALLAAMWILWASDPVARELGTFLPSRFTFHVSPYPVAREGETLLLVAPFANYAGGSQGYNVAGRVQEALRREIDAGRLSGVRAALWPRELRDQESANAAIERSRAALAIWGEYDSGRVLAHLSRGGGNAAAEETRVEKLLPSPADLSTTINTALPEEIRSVALLSLGQLFADQGDYGRARATLGQVLARPPADPHAAASLYFLSGYVSQKGEPPDLDGAIEAYSQALAAQPGMASANYNRGLAYLRRGQTGDFARAIDDLSQAIAALPPDAVLLTNRGAAYLHLASDPAEAPDLHPEEAMARAIRDFDRAIELDPSIVQAYFNRGLAYVRQDDKGRWLLDFEHVLTLEEDHAGAANALCWAFALEQAPESALPYCERAVDLDPSGASRDSRAIVYAELGRYTEAIADIEAYLLAMQAQDSSAYARLSPTRQAWIRMLKNGQNPFDQATLDRLRLE
jgi:tetratricopeptide (TPR) repeat protein/transcriptional regulator with XRE-family HTH domain